MTIEFPSRPSTKDELLARIQAHKDGLEALLASLSPEDLTKVLDEWSVKDHLVHIAVWLGAARAALARQAMWQGLDLPRSPADPRDWDAINATVYAKWRHLPLDEALTKWRSDHGATVAAIEAASQAELDARHVEPDAPEGLTVIEVVSANTYEHYLEHATWVRQQLAARGM